MTIKAQKWIAEKAVELVVAGVIAGGIVLAYNHYQAIKAEAQAGRQHKTVLGTASGVVTDGAAADRSSAAVDQAVAGAADAFANAIEEAKRNEPETARRADGLVPDSVRNAYRERRLARERSGCVSGECPPSRDEDETPKR